MTNQKLKTTKTSPLIPLFDTLANINETIPSVHHYLTDCGIPDALKEYQLSREFLRSYAGSTDTFNAYRREVERLLHWCWEIKKCSLRDLSRNEIRDYLTFVQSPPVAWISSKTVARFMDKDGLRQPNPEWRPFVVRTPKSQKSYTTPKDKQDYELSPKSLQALLATLSTYFTFLLQEEYINVNPVMLIRQKNQIIQRQQSRKVTRKLSHVQWHCVITCAQELATQNPQFERTLFMMSAFYLLGLRISELATTPGRIPKMNDFAPDKEGHWWFTTVGKGNKVRDVAVPDDMLTALKRYRQTLNLSPLPNRSENAPLLAKERGRGNLGTRQVRKLVQDCFDRAIARLHSQKLIDEANDLAAATVHWLRHTAISHDVEFRPREHVRDDAGHGSATTTDQYIDTDRRARHQSAKRKRLLTDIR
jgi:site-specific recombinase XerD